MKMFTVELYNGETHEYMSDALVTNSQLQNEITEKFGNWKSICFNEDRCYRLTKANDVSELLETRLIKLGCYAKDHLNRSIGDPTGPRISIRVLHEVFNAVYRKSFSEEELCDQVKVVTDMIRMAWPDQQTIKKELLLAMVMLFKTSPALSSDLPNKVFMDYLNYMSTGYTQAAYVSVLQQKAFMLNTKNENKSLALALAMLFKDTKFHRTAAASCIVWDALK